MKQKKVEINGLQIAIIEQDLVSSSPPVIYIHGWLDNAASFHSLMPLINSYHGLAVDLPGHGLSSHIPSCAYYHFIDCVSQIIALLDKFNYDKFILIGHSLGACLASIVAGSIPNKISKLILLDAIGPLSTSANLALTKYKQYLKRSKILTNKKNTQYKSISDACKHREMNGYIRKGLLKEIVTRGLTCMEGHYQWSHDSRLMLPSPLRMTENQVLAFLKEITAPTLLISASNGFKVDKNIYINRIAAVKNITTKEINCGHHLHLEEPRLCADLINAFL